MSLIRHPIPQRLRTVMLLPLMSSAYRMADSSDLSFFAPLSSALKPSDAAYAARWVRNASSPRDSGPCPSKSRNNFSTASQ